jgi:hypothetical protein
MRRGMVLVASVAEIEPGHIHPGIDQVTELLGGCCCWS